MKDNITDVNMHKHTEKLQIIGLHTVKKYDLKSLKAIKIDEKINDLLKSGNGTLKQIKNLISMLPCRYSRVYKNIVVTVGRNVLAGVLANDYTDDAYINYGALGDNATTPVIGNTTLNNETFRKVISSQESSGAVATITQYWASGEANDHHYEAGEFIDATATTDSGILFSHWLMDENKTSAESMTIDSSYTFNQ